MHYNWPYGFHGLMIVISLSLIVFGPVGAIIGFLGAYVNSFCILCRFISEEYTHRNTVQEPT